MTRRRFIDAFQASLVKVVDKNQTGVNKIIPSNKTSSTLLITRHMNDAPSDHDLASAHPHPRYWKTTNRGINGIQDMALATHIHTCTRPCSAVRIQASITFVDAAAASGFGTNFFPHVISSRRAYRDMPHTSTRDSHFEHVHINSTRTRWIACLRCRSRPTAGMKSNPPPS